MHAISTTQVDIYTFECLSLMAHSRSQVRIDKFYFHHFTFHFSALALCLNCSGWLFAHNIIIFLSEIPFPNRIESREERKKLFNDIFRQNSKSRELNHQNTYLQSRYRYNDCNHVTSHKSSIELTNNSEFNFSHIEMCFDCLY